MTTDLDLRFTTQAASLTATVRFEDLVVVVEDMALPLAASRLTTAEETSLTGAETGGTLAYGLFSWGGALWLCVGSDHRDLVEADPVRARMLCATPIGPEVWRLDEVIDHWDRLDVAGPHPRDLIGRAAGVGGGIAEGLLLLAGRTSAVPAGEGLVVRLADPVLGRELRHGYRVRVLSQPIDRFKKR